jgi:hypothetical protein
MDLQKLRKELNTRQKALREALTQCVDADHAIDHFLSLHGILHSWRVAPDAPWSYEDGLLDDLEEIQFRAIPKGEEHSLAWIVWHLSRIEDITMNLLVAGGDQIFEKEGWLEKTHSPYRDTLNGTGLDEARRMSQQVDLVALRDYRYAVGRSTRVIVSSLNCEDLKRKPDPGHLQRILDEGGVKPAGLGVVDYWRRRDVAGLLLMPPTRHTIVHWNEGLRLLGKL